MNKWSTAKFDWTYGVWITKILKLNRCCPSVIFCTLLLHTFLASSATRPTICGEFFCVYVCAVVNSTLNDKWETELGHNLVGKSCMLSCFCLSPGFAFSVCLYWFSIASFVMLKSLHLLTKSYRIHTFSSFVTLICVGTSNNCIKTSVLHSL